MKTRPWMSRADSHGRRFGNSMKISRVLAIVGAIATLALVLLFLTSPPMPLPEADTATATPQPVDPVIPLPEPDAEIDPGLMQPLEPVIANTGQPDPAEPGIDLVGWVGNANGTGLGEVEIEVESLGFDGEEIVTISATSNGSGDFLLENIVAGRQYKLEIKPQGSYAGHRLDEFTSNSAEALEKIILDRIQLVDAEGMIVDTNLAPVADFELSVRSLAVEFPDRVIRSDSTGYFKLSAFPAGELRIATNASDYYRIKGLELRPDEYHNLTLMIDRGNYHLTGWVSDDNGAPMADVQVTLKSAFATGDYHSFSYRSTITDENGGFEFAQLGGHRLSLGVYAKGFETNITQHEFKSFADNIEVRLKRQQ